MEPILIWFFIITVIGATYVKPPPTPPGSSKVGPYIGLGHSR